MIMMMYTPHLVSAIGTVVQLRIIAIGKSVWLSFRSYRPVSQTLRYDTIRYDMRCYFNVRSNLTQVSLIYRTEPKTEKWENNYN